MGSRRHLQLRRLHPQDRRCHYFPFFSGNLEVEALLRLNPDAVDDCIYTDTVLKCQPDAINMAGSSSKTDGKLYPSLSLTLSSSPRPKPIS